MALEYIAIPEAKKNLGEDPRTPLKAETSYIV